VQSLALHTQDPKHPLNIILELAKADHSILFQLELCKTFLRDRKQRLEQHALLDPNLKIRSAYSSF
jgi:hypothetical protein